MKRTVLALGIASLGNAALAQDWTGVYFGVQAANSDYSNSYLSDVIPDGPPLDGGGALNGVFVGYNHQFGNVVVGGELAYLSGDVAYDQFPTFLYSDMIDVKARAGYAFGRILPYAVVGYSMTDWTNGTLTTVDSDGFAYGIGAEVRASDRLAVGLEYLQRNLTTDSFVEFPTTNVESDFSTVTLRLSLSF